MIGRDLGKFVWVLLILLGPNVNTQLFHVITTLPVLQLIFVDLHVLTVIYDMREYSSKQVTQPIADGMLELAVVHASENKTKKSM